eukprot:TRINITY_DN9724_c0_g1_i1.p2 TRINITY_DN9724_c0_g1~~TRINITY_DN9724_c0_g1_i1.p2  ORF type:complete len:93 (-),score=6.34 TRINITY_DN9724_c0_g1_i1:129-380(-)
MCDDHGVASKYQHNLNARCAIWCRRDYGPVFGSGFDIACVNNSNISTKSYSSSGNYSIKKRTTLCGQFSGYTIDEIEVFSIQI